MLTIKSSDEISSIFSKGKRLSGKYINVIYVDKGLSLKSSLKHDLDGRVAFIAGKKNGNAVWRNSAKRRMREIYSQERELLKNHDVLMIAKKPILQTSFDDVLINCDNVFRRISNSK